MASISKTWKKAGYRPGQYQKLTITFVSRDGSNVKVKWKLNVKSKGTDNYDYGTRHNKAIIYSPKDKARDSKTYQAKGTHASRSRSGKFTIGGVANETSSLGFWYKNKRVWVRHTDAGEPRSTGVVSKTKVGELKIPKNGTHSISLFEVVTDNIHEYEVFDKESFTVPTLNSDEYLKNTSHYYTFIGWTDKDYADIKPDDVNDSSSEPSTHAAENFELDDDDPILPQIPQEEITEEESEIDPKIIDSATANYFPGSVIEKITTDIDLFAVYRCRTCTYNFYSYDKKTILRSVIHKYGDTTSLVNLDIIDGGKYKVPGYTFQGWIANSKEFEKGSEEFENCTLWPDKNSSDFVINFYPYNKAQLNEIKFYYCNNKDNPVSYQYFTDYKYFDIRQPLKDKNYTNITVYPGYKLVGWSTVPIVDSNNNYLMALPGQGKKPGERYRTSANSSSTYTIYPISGTVKFDYQDFRNNVLQLYAYYEYYTTSYVYTDGEWKLAMPYVYKDGKWVMALSYVYQKDSWKL